MSTVLILNSPELSNTEIFGFTHHNRDTLLQIYYGENCSDFKYVYTDKEGNGVFIEDFANKRAYLNFLKEHKKIMIQLAIS